MAYRADRFKTSIYDELADLIEIFREKNPTTEILDLSVGDPDLPFDLELSKILCKEIENGLSGPSNRYPPQNGYRPLKQAITRWYQTTYNVAIEEDQVSILVGSKEALSHLALIAQNENDLVAHPDPGYPVYRMAIEMAGATPISMPLLAKNDYQPEVSSFSEEEWNRIKLIYLNYPHNPTGTRLNIDYSLPFLKKAKKHGCTLVFDKAYEFTDLTPSVKTSIFSINDFDATENCIEVFSFSKTYNSTGLRIGFSVGSRNTIKALNQIKAVYDNGVYIPIQKTLQAALDRNDIIQASNVIYRERAEACTRILSEANIQYKTPEGAFYLWCELPSHSVFSKMKAKEFCLKCFAETGVMITPGSGFGPIGEGYFRISLTEKKELLETAVQRVALWIKSF